MRLFNVLSTAFEQFDLTVQRYLSSAFNSMNISTAKTKIYNIIFEGIKGIMQNIMFYIEDAFTEQNIFTASRKQSIFSLAKLTGYEPYYGSAASGTVVCSVIRGSALESDATKIFIPNGSILINTETNSRYIVRLSTNDYVIDITKPLVTHEFKVIEGNIRGGWFSAKGVELETFSVETSFSSYDIDSIVVEVNGEAWSKEASLYDMGEGDESYIVSCGYDGSFDIMFGDGIHGKKLRGGDTVFVSWISHSGETGNILTGSATSFSFYTAGRDTYGNNIDLNKYVSVQMKTCIAGGTNPDSIKLIRSMVGYNSRSMILATEENFNLFFKRFSFIGRVNCWSHESTMKVIAVCTSNKITDVTTAEEYFALNVKDLYLSDEYKKQIIESLNASNKTFAGISLEFKNPSFARYAATCVLKIDDQYNQEGIKEALKSFLGEYFINLPEGVEVIYKSDIIQNVLNEIGGIKSFDIHFISEKNEISAYNGFYNKYTIDYYNGILMEKSEKIFYSKDKIAGLDNFGNIVLDSKLEIPLLQGGFSYYNKDEKTGSVIKGTSVRIPTIQYIFI